MMGTFDNLLGSNESLFRDHVPLDFDYIPKVVKFREHQQRQVALAIKPLLQQRNGRNMLVHGPPGVGKTVAIRHLLRELEEEQEGIIPVYINCWQKNTLFKLVLELCEKLDYKFTHNKRSEELFGIIKGMLNKKSVVLVLDEVDKLDNPDFIYQFLEEVYRKSIILITNYKEWIVNLDQRIKSRLMAELLEFGPYNKAEIKGIMEERMKYAFIPGVWNDPALEKAASKAFELKDVRAGLYLLREAGNAAEDTASRKITEEHMEQAMEKLQQFYIKKKDKLEDETKFMLELVKKNSGSKIGDLFKLYQEEGGASSYKTFQRKINKLQSGGFITLTKLSGGAEGNTTLVKFARTEKTLDEF